VTASRSKMTSSGCPNLERRQRCRGDVSEFVVLEAPARGSVLAWLAAAFLLRVAVAVYTSWPYDVLPWYRTGLNALEGLGLYDRADFPYPPLFGHVLQAYAKLVWRFWDPDLFGISVPEFAGLIQTGMFVKFVSSPLFNVVSRIPLFAIDLLAGMVIYWAAHSAWNDERGARSALLGWLFNPLVIFVSSVHGMFDALSAMLVMLAVVLAWRSAHPWIAGAMWSFAGLSKTYPWILGPMLLALVIRNGRTRSAALFLAGAAIAAAVVIAPVAGRSGYGADRLIGATVTDRLSSLVQIAGSPRSRSGC
jgi:hypothetical protein